ncbi:MAG: flagellar biosynthesis anti-sigma factor FlgM [Gemmatimonadota bacterium]
MSIHKIGSDLIRPSGPGGAEKEDRARRRAKASPGEEPQARGDRVELSPEGLARAAQLDAKEEMDTDRLAEIRSRIQSGFYDSEHVAEAVAGRLLHSGDLSPEP